MFEVTVKTIFRSCLSVCASLGIVCNNVNGGPRHCNTDLNTRFPQFILLLGCYSPVLTYRFTQCQLPISHSTAGQMNVYRLARVMTLFPRQVSPDPQPIEWLLWLRESGSVFGAHRRPRPPTLSPPASAGTRTAQIMSQLLSGAGLRNRLRLVYVTGQQSAGERC